MTTALRNGPVPKSPATAGGWDSEAVVLRGTDRPDLHARTAALLAFLDRHPDTPLADVAATLAADLAPGGRRLGLVATTTADLRTKLGRAVGRLADPGCKLIRDAAGLYYFGEPLAEKGSVALLFPGEGAQYLHMLADLGEAFPEVEETFAWCDQLAADAGRPELSLRRILHPPADLSPEGKAAAEAELRKVGPSLIGVLVGDLAISKILRGLQVPAAAVAGHSVGELGALLFAGAMASGELIGPQIVGLMEDMQHQEENAGTDTALIAVGAGRKVVGEVAAAVAGGAVVVAMDNCPHQCVAVGPSHLVAAVEAVLAERGLLCERLPFRRPYHTPLFEPYMGAFRAWFGATPFAAPHTPIYCGSTGGRFPDDPAVIARLAVESWVNPVEFVGMVESLYADGVRVFVECGPRGNLSAFVEDTLRGRPFAAVPANLPRRSGPLQINHLVAQLAAHGVVLNHGYLYERRETRRVGWEGSPGFVAPTGRPPIAGGETPGSAPATRVEAPTGRPPNRRAEEPGVSPPANGGRPVGATNPGDGLLPAVINDYLGVMEHFLDTQRVVMEAFLAGHAAGPLPADWFAPPEPKPLALVGEIVAHAPGREITFRRPLDLREDLYVDDHTLGGRGVSRADPTQNGLPVLPMTFSLEAMAEAAALLCPGKVVVAVRNVRLHRWVPYDPEPTTFEVRATVTGVDEQTGTVEVAANTRDLGNSFLRNAADKIAAEATVVLADRYPDPPAPLPFTLTGERPCRSAVEDLRRNMFHGPVFQMITGLGRYGPEGVEGTLEVKPRTAWFRSDADPHTLLDPILTDAAMHLIGAWHLEHPDWTGRILLPVGVTSLEYFGPPPPAGTPMLLRVHNEEETARSARHGLEVIGPDGRVWLRMTGSQYWRFYLPFGHVNFFGPKDEYFLSRDLPAAVPAGAVTGRCQYLDPPADLKQPVLRAAGVRVTMTAREYAEYLTVPEAGRDDWFFRRLLAKDAARAARHGGATFPADMEADQGPDGRYTIRPRPGAAGEPFPAVSVAAAGGKVVAFAAYAPHVGVALVPVPKGTTPVAEVDLRATAARRAVADALQLDEAAVGPPAADGTVPLGPAGLAQYPEFTGRRLRVGTANVPGAIVATTVCEADPA